MNEIFRYGIDPGDAMRILGNQSRDHGRAHGATGSKCFEVSMNASTTAGISAGYRQGNGRPCARLRCLCHPLCPLNDTIAIKNMLIFAWAGYRPVEVKALSVNLDYAMVTIVA